MRRWLALAVALLLAVAAGTFLLRAGDPEAPGAAPAPVPPPAATGGPEARAPAPVTAPAAPEPESLPPGLLVVKVSSAAGPVAGAEVRLWMRVAGGVPGPWQAAGRVHSGADGAAALPAAPGAYLVSAAAPGLARALADAVRPAGEARTEVAVRLVPAAVLTGTTVEHAGGAPIPLATVIARPVRPGIRLRQVPLPPEERIFATSDGRGEFRLAGLSPGPHEVEASAPGHSTGHWRDVAVPPSSPVRLELGAAATIEGRVTRDGHPVPGARVTLLGTGEPVSVQSGPGGGFAADVEPGTHRAFAQLGDASGTAGRLLQVPAGGVLRDVEIRLGPSAAIGGTVQSGGQPVQGATISVSLAGDARETSRARSGADGSYELRPLRPGTYAVSVAAAGRAPVGAPGVTVRGGERLRLDLVLPAPAAIEGTVTDPDGAPVPGALVSADAAAWARGAGAARGGNASPVAPTVATRADGSGSYALEGIAPGPVRVTARRDVASPSAVRVVSVDEGERVRVDLSLVDGGVVTGAVRDASGEPVAGATVLTGLGTGLPRPGEIRQVTSDANGIFLLALAPGSYGLLAIRPGARLRPGMRSEVLATVRVTAGQRVEQDLLLPPEPPPTITGTVLEPGGAPAGGALVWSGAVGPGMAATLADADGAFALAAPAGPALQLAARNGGRTGTASVDVPASGVVVQLQPGAALHGRLAGDPPPESFTASIGSRGLAPGGAPVEMQFANDTFDLDDVVPGEVSVHVRTSDGRIGDAQARLSAGETGNVTVVLSPAATVTGRLVDSRTGLAVSRALVRVDGLASRRSGLSSGGRFTRAVTEGDHVLSVLATGYQPLTRPFRAAAGAPVDLGDLQLVPGSARPDP